MFIYSKCAHCNKEARSWTWTKDRVSLVKKKGENHEVFCKSCGLSTEISVDDYYAKPSTLALIIALSISLTSASIFLFNYHFFPNTNGPDYVVSIVTGHLAVPLIIFLMFAKAERDRVGFFNRHKYHTRTDIYSGRKDRKKMKAWPRG